MKTTIEQFENEIGEILENRGIIENKDDLVLCIRKYYVNKVLFYEAFVMIWDHKYDIAVDITNPDFLSGQGRTIKDAVGWLSNNVYSAYEDMS